MEAPVEKQQTSKKIAAIIFLIGCCSVSIFYVYNQIFESEFTSEKGCNLEIKTLGGNSERNVKRIAGFYACEKDIEEASIKVINGLSPEEDQYSINYGSSTIDGEPSFLYVIDERSEGLDQIASVNLVQNRNAEIFAPVVILNEKYYFFKLSLTPFIPCSSAIAEELQNDDCYTEEDQEWHNQYGGYWVFDLESKEFEFIIRTAL